MKQIALGLVLLLGLVSVGCGSGDLARAAQTLDQIGKIATSSQTLVISLNNQGLLSDDEARPLMDGFRKVGQVGLGAVGVVHTLQAQKTLTPNNKAQIAAAMKAVQDAISDLTVNGAIGIKNPTTQKQVQQLIGQSVQLAASLVDLFVKNFGQTPDEVLGVEVAYASR